MSSDPPPTSGQPPGAADAAADPGSSAASSRLHAAALLHESRRYRITEFLRRLWTKAFEDDVFFMAGAVAFNLLVAIAPLLVLGVGVSGYILTRRFGDPTSAIMRLVTDFVPAAAGDVDMTSMMGGLVDTLMQQRGGLTLFGALFFVWVATRLVGSVRAALREIFDVGRARGIVEGKIFDVQVVVLAVLLLTLNLGVTVVFEAALSFGLGTLGLAGPWTILTRRLLGMALAFASIWILFLIIYRYLPARRIPWRTAVVAATFASVCHELLKGGFTWYATEVADYGSTFGNLATVAVLYFWIYYEAVVFILAGEVAQVYTMRKASNVEVRRSFLTDP
ncbi:MAG: YihY/virulence factor BrkB family protein [Longimicrobiales bacterium]